MLHSARAANSANVGIARAVQLLEQGEEPEGGHPRQARVSGQRGEGRLEKPDSQDGEEAGQLQEAGGSQKQAIAEQLRGYGLQRQQRAADEQAGEELRQ